MTFPLFGAAVVPSLLILWFFHSRDRHPEPRAVLLRTFWYGVIITVPAGLAEVALGSAAEPLALSPVAAWHDCRHGRIEAGWALEGDRVTYRVTLPPGCSGRLGLKKAQGLAVNGQPAQPGDVLPPGTHEITFRV